MKKTFSMTNTFSTEAMSASVNSSCANMINAAALAKIALALFVLSAIRIIKIIRRSLIIKSEYCSSLQTA